MKIYKATNPHKVVDEMNRSEISKIEKEIKIIDLYDKIAEITEKQHQSVLKHYKPKGQVFTIISSGSLTDSIAAAHCNMKSYPIIQLGHEGQSKLLQTEDRLERARFFADYIGNIAKEIINDKRDRECLRKELANHDVFAGNE